MSSVWVNKYKKAGAAVASAKRIARKLIKPGVSFLDIANQCEKTIFDHDCELAFPINMSLNEIAAHYSPTIDDTTLIPEKGLLKIDLGAHFQGHIADSAITINIDSDPKLQNFVDAAVEALEAAVSKFKPGVRLYELGEVIAQKTIEHGLRPITNLGGHELKEYNLHAGPFIPNYKEKSHNQILKPGDAYACEPFTTSGVGRVVNGKNSYIYRFIKKIRKNIPYEFLGYMNKIEDETKRLPFSPRLLIDKEIVPKNKVQRVLNFFLRKKVLDHYPILIEKTGAYVAQAEHTLIIDEDGNTIVTTIE
ncbi:MAG: type II methionyl aminopeptidase [Candidatus Lokiarchaeota archaeon]|nr:type II methionyl aminopeptidase [Candidatus Lokiarchaeota archaeon]